MPSLIEIHMHTQNPKPSGWLGVPVHGLIYAALESAHPKLSKTVHEAQIKPFRVAGVQWQEDTVRFQVGILSDELKDVLQEALQAGTYAGEAHHTLNGEVLQQTVLQESTYSELYESHLVQGSLGRNLHFDFQSPVAFQQYGISMPFPVPRLMFLSLAQRFKHFGNLDLGEGLDHWVQESLSIQDFKLFPRKVYFKGMRDSTVMGSTGHISLFIQKPGVMEPPAVRMLTEYANYAGIGYKTTYGLGNVVASGWAFRNASMETASSAD